MRRQTRRPDVRIHMHHVGYGEWTTLRGLPVTKPSLIAADLLRDNEDPEAVAQIIADAIRTVRERPETFAESLAPHASRFGLLRADGMALLSWLLGLVGDPQTDQWMVQARAYADHSLGHQVRGPGKGT